MMVRTNSKNLKVALVTESLWRMAGANRVLEVFADMFPNADIFALFGEKEKLSKNLQSHKIFFSSLNNIPFIKKIYRYTFNFWPLYIEKFDFSDYDLVISSSASVAHGVITPLSCKHIAYIHSPMRYAWDLSKKYANIVKFCLPKRVVVDISLNLMRIWDVSAARRPDILIANSHYVSKRIHKYWGLEVDGVLTPPSVEIPKVVSPKGDYYVAGAPFEPNKNGGFLVECAAKLGFNLKIIGTGSLKRKLEREYGDFKNIEFLDWIDDEKKWRVMSGAKGFIVPGIEDYGIFLLEALKCGTPVLAYREGGATEIVQDGINGMFFDEWSIINFGIAFERFGRKKWNSESVRNSVGDVGTDAFVKSFEKFLVDNK